MGASLSNAFPVVREAFEQQNQLFTSRGLAPLTDTVYPVPVFNTEDQKIQQQNITATQYAQPAIGTLSMAMYNILKSAGFKADFTAGHSFGELTALWAAGVYDEATFLALAKARGEAMSAKNGQTDAGTMMAVKADYDTVAEYLKSLDGVKIANVNSDSQIIIGGSKSAIQQAGVSLKNKGLRVVY